MVLSVSDLKKKYDQDDVVKGISFHVEKGEVFGFLGKNGAGKSTTVNILTGISRPSSGEISILGTPYHQINHIKKRIGVLPDNSNYFNDLTLLQHLVYFSKIKGISADKKYLYAMLERVGLADSAHKKVGQFSLGMKKKLGIAQALLGDPELLFLDEPTAALDMESTLAIRGLIRSQADQGTTIFMTSHNLDEVEKLCTRIAILEEGQLTKIGSIHELQESFSKDIRLSIQIQGDSESIQRVREILLEREWIHSFHYKDREIELQIPSMESIPQIVQVAVENQLLIYGVSTEKVSLEQIFLA